LAALRAPAAMIGPTQDSQMLWAIWIDTFVFNIHLELPMLLGIILIVGSGVLTLWREKARGTPLPHSVAADSRGLGSSDDAAEDAVGINGRLVPAE